MHYLSGISCILYFPACSVSHVTHCKCEKEAYNGPMLAYGKLIVDRPEINTIAKLDLN